MLDCLKTDARFKVFAEMVEADAQRENDETEN